MNLNLRPASECRHRPGRPPRSQKLRPGCQGPHSNRTGTLSQGIPKSSTPCLASMSPLLPPHRRNLNGRKLRLTNVSKNQSCQLEAPNLPSLHSLLVCCHLLTLAPSSRLAKKEAKAREWTLIHISLLLPPVVLPASAVMVELHLLCRLVCGKGFPNVSAL